MLRAILKEPLVHFLLAGAMIFLVQGLTGRAGDDERGQILITQGDVEHLAAGFTRMRQRPPSPTRTLPRACAAPGRGTGPSTVLESARQAR